MRVYLARSVLAAAALFNLQGASALGENPFADPGSVFLFEDPPLAPPADLAETAEPAGDLDALLLRLSELETRDAAQTGLLRSLDEQLKQQKAQEQAKKEADAKKPTIRWSAQMQADWYGFNQDDASKATFGNIENGEAFRRARFGLFGDYGPTEYRVEMDFALANRPSFLDVFAGVHDVPVLGRVRAGHFFEPFSLERVTPNRFLTFMERSLIDAPFAPARNMGVMAHNTYLDERGAWGLGYFRSNSDPVGDDVGDNFESAITGRVTYLPYYDEATNGERLVHLGLGYSARGADEEQVRFRTQPEARIGAATPNVPFFVDTGPIPADSYQLVGLEAACVCGPFSLQSEYMLAPVDSQNDGSLCFQGWYLVGSWFLTGEHRPYRRDIGVFDRVIPHEEAVRYDADKRFACGPGAWEIAVRISQIDLNDGPIQGGELTDFTVGLNWYLNPYLRFTSNYVRAMCDHPVGGESNTDIFATRVGFEF